MRKTLLATACLALLGTVAAQAQTTVIERRDTVVDRPPAESKTVTIKDHGDGCTTKTVRKENDLGDSKTVRKEVCD